MTEHTFAENRYEKMPYRRCGCGGLKLPAISLGFWQALGETGAEDTCRACAYYAFDHGVTHFDLANNYGTPPGHSEQVLGRVLKDMPRDELIVSTKAGYSMWPGPYGDWGSRKYLLASLDQSLRRLGLDYVDIFYHHRPDPDTPLEETLGALNQAVRQGKALYAGVSNYGGLHLSRAAAVAAEHDWAPILIDQPNYHMLNRRVETDLLAEAHRLGVGVIAFCPLAQGQLTDRYLDGLPADSRMGRRGEKGRQWWRQREADGTWDKVRRLSEIAKRRGQTMAQLALTWTLRDARVTSALIGASRPEQIAENLSAATAAPLGEEELENIEGILAA